MREIWCLPTRNVAIIMTTTRASQLPSSATRDEIGDLISRRRPAHAMEQVFYTSDAVYRTEIDRVFRRAWLYAGHASEIPKPGDFITFELEGDSVILIRAADGQIHALANVCRHRGSRICDTPHGHAAKLVCPYHQWVYDTDGRLLAARHM